WRTRSEPACARSGATGRGVDARLSAASGTVPVRGLSLRSYSGTVPSGTVPIDGLVLRPAVQMEDEIELRARRVVVVELHPTPGLRVLACAARDRDDRVARVGERPLDRDLSVRQERRPVALPALADDDSHAVALVAAELARIGAVVDVVREREDVAGQVGRR